MITGNTSDAQFEASVSDMIIAGNSVICDYYTHFNSSGIFNIGRQRGHSTQNILLEIKGLKFAENKDFGHCLRGAVPAILAIAIESATSNGSSPTVGSLVNSLKSQLDCNGNWGYTILSALIQDTDDEYKCIFLKL